MASNRVSPMFKALWPKSKGLKSEAVTNPKMDRSNAQVRFLSIIESHIDIQPGQIDIVDLIIT
jgi:hypothetical protein